MARASGEHKDVPFPSPAVTPTQQTTRYPNFRTSHKREDSFAGGHVTKASTSESDWSLPDQPRSVARKVSESTINPPVRVFPRPPADGNWTPSIRPGSVKSITLERGGDDDAASRRSVRSVNVNKPNGKARPPLPSMPSSDSILPAMVQAIETSINTKPASRPPSTNGNVSSGHRSRRTSHDRSRKTSDTRSRKTSDNRSRKTSKTNRDQRPDKTTQKAHAGETADRVPVLNGHSSGQEGGLGIIGSFDKRLNRSVMSLGVKAKAEKVVNQDPQPRLASLYLVTGLFKDPAEWALSDKDAVLGVQPAEDSLGVFWRPNMLGNTWSGEKSDELMGRGGSKSGRSGSSVRRDANGQALPGTKPEGASRLVARAMKYAHPKDIEVINSTLAPPTTCHTFTFTVARQGTLSAIAAQATRASRIGTQQYDTFNPQSASTPFNPVPVGQEHLRGTTSSSDLVFYGVTLTVWSHADKDRADKLNEFKQRVGVRPREDSVLSEPSAGTKDRSKRRTKLPWLKADLPVNDRTPSETGISDYSDMETTFTATDVNGSLSNLAPAFGESTDVFWLPYGLTLVSRYPIYDIMQDYLRLSWARYQKDAKSHMRQIFTLLNTEAPRPGDLFRLPIGNSRSDEVTIEATMPGALDFDKGVFKVDFQMWPIFQCLDVDNIITCVEVALSNSGRVIVTSRHPPILGTAVQTLKYIVELRGWNGIALPHIHTRDATFIIEDPGPYIIGLPTEARYMLTPPPEVVIVDLDTNTVSCKQFPHGVVTPREKRMKARSRLLAAFGPTYPSEKSVPFEYRVSFPKGAFRNINRVNHGPIRPRYLGERLTPPDWWNQNAVISVFDRIMADKHKKPSLFQRLTKSGFLRAQEQLSANDMLAKAMMRKRALHYVERRDDFDLKLSRITRRLQKLVQEGEHWKQRFETFERYAERLAIEASELRIKIDKEQREARRLSNINTEQGKQNAHLQEQLDQTESARAEAMRQLSDMHQSIQDLERERNAIMDAIEMQITNALEHMPITADLRRLLPPTPEPTDPPTSPTASPPGTPLSQYSVPIAPKKPRRPGARDSTQTTFSWDSQASNNPISVLGALIDGSIRREHLGSIADTDEVSNADRFFSTNKNDSISQRVAIIQAKLELALLPQNDGPSSQDGHGSYDGHGSSVDSHASYETEEEWRDARGDAGSPSSPVSDYTTRASSVRSSKSYRSSSRGPGAPRRTRKLAIRSPSRATDHDSDREITPVEEEPLDQEEVYKLRPTIAYRPLVLRPPPRKVTQKKSYESMDSSGSVLSSDHTAHVRRPREVLVTPPEPQLKTMPVHHDDPHRKEVIVDERPSSVISTMTVTFGSPTRQGRNLQV